MTKPDQHAAAPVTKLPLSHSETDWFLASEELRGEPVARFNSGWVGGNMRREGGAVAGVPFCLTVTVIGDPDRDFSTTNSNHHQLLLLRTTVLISDSNFTRSLNVVVGCGLTDLIR